MRILITGSSGFVGSRLADYYKEKYEVWAPAHGELDFTEEKAVLEAVGRFHPEVVIHCGAISDVAACSRNPELSFAVNVKGTQYLARACRQVGARFVFSSSDQVYFDRSLERAALPERADRAACRESSDREARQDRAEELADFLKPHRETEKPAPMPIYGQHKLMAEQLALKEQPDSVILRLTWMYGPLTQEERKKGRRNLLSMLEEALRTNQPAVFSPADYRGVTDVAEVVVNMEAAWKLPAGVYNYGSTGKLSMYETVRQAMAAIGREALVVRGEGNALRNIAMDTAKLEAAGIRFSMTEQRMEACLRGLRFTA